MLSDELIRSLATKHLVGCDYFDDLREFVRDVERAIDSESIKNRWALIEQEHRHG